MEELVAYLGPVIQARVARALWKRRGSGLPVRQDVGDLTQDVFTALFANAGRLLLEWDPARGLSLRNFVGLLASHQVSSLLRSRRRDNQDEPRDPSSFESLPSTEHEEPRLLSRDLLSSLLSRFRETLSPLGLEMFERLYVEEQSVEQVEHECGLSSDAVYQWRCRLRRLARETLLALEGPGPLPAPAPQEAEG